MTGGSSIQAEGHRARAGLDLHGGRIREACEGLGIPEDQLLDLSTNVNFLGPSRRSMTAARRAVEQMASYPLDPPDPLRRAAAEFLGVPHGRVLIGNGSSELLYLLVAHLRPRRALVFGPTFSEYERAARAWGAEVDLALAAEIADFRFSAADISGMESRLADSDVVFLCNPNNPTGHTWDRSALEALVEACGRGNTIVCCDESFLAFTDEWPRESISLPGNEHVVTLHSLTKILSVPGLRVGALVLPPLMARALEPQVPPWNVNCVAQAAAAEGLADVGLLERTPGAVARARGTLIEALSRVPGVQRVLPGAANFVCLRLAAPAQQVCPMLLHEHGILVRDLTHMPGMNEYWVRVAVRGSPDNGRFVVALAAVLLALGQARGDRAAHRTHPSAAKTMGG